VVELLKGDEGAGGALSLLLTRSVPLQLSGATEQRPVLKPERTNVKKEGSVVLVQVP